VKSEVSRQIFDKYTSIKFSTNPSSGRRIVVCGRTDRLTDMSTLRVAFGNFVKASEKLKFGCVLPCQVPYVHTIRDYISHHANDHCIMGQGRVLMNKVIGSVFHKMQATS
jgi:hypothetical protein